MALYTRARAALTKVDEVTVPPRDAATFTVPAGHFFRITSVEGPQVGDLNLWNAQDLSERFYSGKTRALHGTHITTGQQMWSAFPHLRPLATITHSGGVSRIVSAAALMLDSSVKSNAKGTLPSPAGRAPERDPA